MHGNQRFAEMLASIRAALARSSDILDDPLSIHFEPIEPASHLDAWRALARRPARAPAAMSNAVLYLHVPLCGRLCSYCLLSRQRASSRAATAAYVAALRREMRLYSEVVHGLRFSALHVGGGTPSVLLHTELDALLSDAESLFARVPGPFLVGIEAHPGSTDVRWLEVLARHQVQRVSFGVETLTAEVLRNVNRSDQTRDDVERAVRAARGLGLRVNLDLLAGLPGETLESFEASLSQLLDFEPDSLSVNRYLVESSPLGAFGFVPDAATRSLACEMLASADRRIRAQRPPTRPSTPPSDGAYGTQYVWGTSATDRGYFQQDMLDAGSTLAMGAGGMGHVCSGYFYVPDGGLSDYLAALGAGRSPAVLAARTGMAFERAFYATRQLFTGRLEASQFERLFGVPLAGVFGAALNFLEEQALVADTPAGWCATPGAPLSATELLALLLGGSRPTQVRGAARHGHPETVTAGPSESQPAAPGRVALVSRPGSGADQPVTAGWPRQGIGPWRAGFQAIEALQWAAAESARAAIFALYGDTRDQAWLEPLRDAAALAPGVERWALLPIERGEGIGALLDALREAGFIKVAFELDAPSSASHAVRLLSEVRARRGLEVLAPGDRLAVPSDPEKLLDLPPSLIWCRIAIRGARTASARATEPVQRW